MLALYAALRWGCAAAKVTLGVFGAVAWLELWVLGNAGDAIILGAMWLALLLVWNTQQTGDMAYAFVARRRAVRAIRRPVRR